MRLLAPRVSGLGLGLRLSGHTLKHVAAAAGIGCVAMMLDARSKASDKAEAIVAQSSLVNDHLTIDGYRLEPTDHH